MDWRRRRPGRVLRVGTEVLVVCVCVTETERERYTHNKMGMDNNSVVAGSRKKSAGPTNLLLLSAKEREIVEPTKNGAKTIFLVGEKCLP